MKIFVFDTNVIIIFLKGNLKYATLFAKIKELKILPIISVMTKIELLAFTGLTPRKEKVIRQVLEEFQIEDLNNNIIEQTIKLRKKYKLKMPDAIIAATALTNKAMLVTHDTKHFQKIKALKLFDPIK